MSNWINVNDQLPEIINDEYISKHVVILIEDEDSNLGYSITIGYIMKMNHFNTGNSFAWSISDDCYEDKEVKYWMPLPELPYNNDITHKTKTIEELNKKFLSFWEENEKFEDKLTPLFDESGYAWLPWSLDEYTNEILELVFQCNHKKITLSDIVYDFIYCDIESHMNGDEENHLDQIVNKCCLIELLDDHIDRIKNSIKFVEKCIYQLS